MAQEQVQKQRQTRKRPAGGEPTPDEHRAAMERARAAAERRARAGTENER